MNYIKRLEGEKQAAKEVRERGSEAMQELLSYLCSNKFRCGDSLDGYVNVQDVLDRLVPIRSAFATV